jgi:hypothetical protein
MARYSEVYIGDELTKLRDGLEVLERVVDSETLKDLDLWLYGVVTDPYLLDVAKEAIISNAEEFMNEEGSTTLEEGDVELAEIAIAVPINYSSHIDILYGRGYPLRELEFAYQSEGEGVRTLGFYNAYTTSASVKISDMGEKAIAESDSDLDEFLKDKGKGTAMQIKRKVERSEEATTNAPHVPEPPKLKTPQPEPPAEETPRSASLKVARLSDIVEEFLG